jgi:hypothetical protein
LNRQEEDLSTEKALQTVTAGQKSENLLDFDSDDVLPAENTLAGFSGTAVSSALPSTAAAGRAPAAKSIDDLLSLFNSMPAAPVSQPVSSPIQTAPANGLGSMASPLSQSSPKPQPQTAAAQSDDLLGLF